MTLALQIIVNCTNRKRAVIPKDLYLRDTSSKGNQDIQKKAIHWWARLSNNNRLNTPKMQAVNLYSGAYWAIVRDLPALAKQSGFNPKLWILSAGYGLISSETSIYPYSATFASNSLDSVSYPVKDKTARDVANQNWWEMLSSFNGLTPKTPRSFVDLVNEFPTSYFLVLVSPDYLKAAEKDLSNAINNTKLSEKFIIISSKPNKALMDNLVSYNARLQHYVGGIRSSLQANVAAMIFKNIKSKVFDIKHINNYLNNLILSSPEMIKYERRKMDDSQVLGFISSTLENEPSLSCTKLLRRLRSSNYACEQGRFRELYWSIKEK